jgi:predicted Zn-dependent protease
VKLRYLFFFCLLAAAYAQHKKSAALSDADEIRIGKILAEKLVKQEQLGVTRQEKDFERYLQSIGDRIAPHAGRRLPWRFHYDPDPSFKSAFALPGGQIFVGGGALALMDSEDELAVVLAHEMEHVDLNQCRERLQQKLVEQHLTVAHPEKIKVEPFFPGYGHDGELKADLEGVKLAARAGYSANAAVRLLKTFAALYDNQLKETPAEAKSKLEERIAQVESLISTGEVAKGVQERPLKLP